MPRSRNVLFAGGNGRAMLICASSYAIRGFSYILLFVFCAGYYVIHISCSAGDMLAYWEGFTGSCALDDMQKNFRSVCMTRTSGRPAWQGQNLGRFLQ